MLRFIEKAAKDIPNYTGVNGAEKLAAHMMGRWKSGIVTYLFIAIFTVLMFYRRARRFNSRQGRQESCIQKRLRFPAQAEHFGLPVRRACP